MLKQTCTMLEGQVEELEVMNDEYQDRETQWNMIKYVDVFIKYKLIFDQNLINFSYLTNPLKCLLSISDGSHSRLSYASIINVKPRVLGRTFNNLPYSKVLKEIWFGKNFFEITD